jgi:PHD/YefM family antitoxin component YafN of YafNO toxin-antitoxin module
MLNITQDIDALTNFKRHTSAYLARLKKSGKPLVLTINGKAELIVQDAASYQKLLEAVERLEALESVHRGLEDAQHGRSRSVKQMRAEKQKKYDL